MQKKKGTWGKKKTPEPEENKSKPKGKGDLKKELRAECEKEGTYLHMKKIEVIPTGSLILNRLIGNGSLNNEPGGFPRGGVTEIFGDEATGKTTLALLACKNVLDAGEPVVWADFEHSLRLQKTYVENLGIDTNSPNFFGITPMNFESGVEKIAKAMVAYHPAIIVIDSVTGMIPESEDNEYPTKMVQIGKHAKLTSQFLNWITKRLDKYNTALVLINQTRVDIKMSSMPGMHGGPKKISSGGQAPKYYTTVRIELKQTSERESVMGVSNLSGLSEKKMVSQMVKAICVKNKFDVAYKSGPIYITFGKGVDNILSLVYLGENTKVFKDKAAGYISWEDTNGKYSFNIQGRMNVVKYLEEHSEILEAVTPYLIPSASTEAMIERKKELEGMDEKDLSKDDLEELNKLRSQLKGSILDDDSLEVEVDDKIDSVEKSEDGKEELDDLKSVMGSGEQG